MSPIFHGTAEERDTILALVANARGCAKPEHRAELDRLCERLSAPVAEPSWIRGAAERIAHDSKRLVEISTYLTPEWVEEIILREMAQPPQAPELGRRGAKVRILAKTRNVGKSWHRDDLRAIESPQGWMQRWEADK